MNSHVDDLLAEYGLGTLSEAEAARCAAHLQGCARCRDELSAVSGTLASLALALPPQRPPAALRSRLLEQAAQGRFERFVGRLMELLDLAEDRVRGILRAVDEPSAWEGFPLPGIQLMHLPHGPRVVAADVGLVRVEAGRRFPFHRHLDGERVLVLQGGIREDDGRVFYPGDETAEEGGTAHGFDVLPGEALIYLVVLSGGVEFPELAPAAAPPPGTPS